MKVINDTAKERLITLELTQNELATLVSAFGHSCHGERAKFYNSYKIDGLNPCDSTDFYIKILNLLKLNQ
jgi:hypothetical protein